MEANGRVPILGIGVEVEECFIHCAKSLLRSHLWNPSSWVSKEALPDMAKALADHANLPEMGAEKVRDALAESYSKRLY